jgi:hypothetical protein
VVVICINEVQYKEDSVTYSKINIPTGGKLCDEMFKVKSTDCQG